MGKSYEDAKSVHAMVDERALARAREWLAGQEDAGHIAPCDELESLYALICNLERACEGKQDIHEKAIVLERFEGGVALLFDEGAPSPFIVASGYDPATRSWSSGSYHAEAIYAAADAMRCAGVSTVGYATRILRADPDVLQDGVCVWQSDDLAANLADQGMPCDEAAVDALERTMHGMGGWNEYATQIGNETIVEAIWDLKRAQERAEAEQG